MQLMVGGNVKFQSWKQLSHSKRTNCPSYLHYETITIRCHRQMHFSQELFYIQRDRMQPHQGYLRPC